MTSICFLYKGWQQHFLRFVILLFVSVGFSFPVSAQQSGLIVNEISNGANGAEENMEFLVVGCPGSTVNLRGIIIDDNNGNFNTGGPGSGVGIATGHYRFTNTNNWAAVPVGSIILVYNNDDKNRSISLPNDPSDSNQDKVLKQIADCHGGKLNDSRPGVRMSGEGKFAETIAALFKISKQKHFNGRSMKPYNFSLFTPKSGKQLGLF